MANTPSMLEELRRKGVRITTQRRAVLEIVAAATKHCDAATLLRHARQLHAGIDRATVYRTLDLLKKHGLLNDRDCEAPEGSDHLHLTCFVCGTVEHCTNDIFPQLKAAIARDSGFEVREVRLEIGGCCRLCIRGGSTHKALEIFN
ncbi:MAG: transcriptional repressor [Bryobacteraceae bacterium]|nr:transcriptional repressor [Bryobacteraceae bacterium]